MNVSAEKKRLKEDKSYVKNWKRWGPYLAERQWGTVREDYSEDGNCWNYFPHDDARSRAYRWGEDGLLGLCDREGRLCLGVALWNGKDPILKERLFGLTGHQGNHGEDVKELYYYLDSTPTHSYMKALYKYPHEEYPYSQLVEVNARRDVWMPEYEIEDTGVFDRGYFDVKAEYCKSTPNDILCKYTISNRGSSEATIHVLPSLWFRNVWSWGKESYCNLEQKPKLEKVSPRKVTCFHPTLGINQGRQRVTSLGVPVPFEGEDAEQAKIPDLFYWEVDVDPDGKEPELLFTENDTNYEKLYNLKNKTPYLKDSFHAYVIHGKTEAVNPEHVGTKCAAHYILNLKAKQEVTLRTRLYYKAESPVAVFEAKSFEGTFKQRKQEADEYYDSIIPNKAKEERLIARQAYAGLLWSKQFYYYVVKEWLHGDQGHPPPPRSRLDGRNKDWIHLFNNDIISMPDKWEYPWYASWDLAFHMITMADVDLKFAKDQLILLMREWYMHPNGQIPAYEFSFEDVNPPVHAYAVLKVYKASGPKGERDICFLARCFHKLILNFTWWINRKDVDGKNIFSGGFLGLDNIGVFDRSKPLPMGGSLAQADATAWMAFFCVIMLEISLILARRDHVYEDLASKFFEHFVAIVEAINEQYGKGLWDEEDGFYYDHIRTNSHTSPMKIMSMVGLVPLFSCLVLKASDMRKHPGFYKRTKWFLEHRKDLADQISFMIRCDEYECHEALLLALVKKDQLVKVLGHLLDEKKFLSPYGIRSLSKHHKDNPFVLHVGDSAYSVRYEPGESESKLFGGNSNWRGPIWFPMNYLIIENLRRYDYFYGDSLKVECPTGSGNYMRLNMVARELSSRLSKIFLPDLKGVRPCHGDNKRYATDPNFKDLILFHEYFHGDTGRGCGASHQTGWTALVATSLKYLHIAQMEMDALSDFSSEGEVDHPHDN